MDHHGWIILCFLLLQITTFTSAFVPSLKSSNQPSFQSDRPIHQHVTSTRVEERFPERFDGRNASISCPKKCDCIFQNNVYEVNCESQGFSDVPNDLPKFAGIVYLSNNRITNLSRRTFYGLNQIETLSLSSNKINFIHARTFSELKNLSFLDLSVNPLKLLPDVSVFKGLAHLKLLNLSRVELDSVTNNSFNDLVALDALDLSYNHIRKLHFNQFSDLIELKFLDLSYNNLQEVNENVFASLAKLKRLDLKGNEIITLSTTTFQNLHDLVELDLSHNIMEVVEPGTFSHLTSLRELKLQNNKIKRICERSFTSLLQLTHINLSANNLTALTGSPFKSNRNLKELILSHMPYLKSVSQNTFSGLTRLERLFVQNNSALKSINPDAFDDLDYLKYLDISFCNLTLLHKNQLASLPNLTRLSAQGNPWTCDCSMQYLSEWLDDKKNLSIDHRENLTCASPSQLVGHNILQFYESEENCTNTTVTGPTHYLMYKVGSSALIECNVTGNPPPSITWITPKMGTFRWHPSAADDSLETKLDELEKIHSCNRSLDRPSSNRLQVLDNGNLYITKVRSIDAGHYVCVVSNSFGTSNATILFLLDFRIMYHVKVMSMLVGVATAMGFMLITLLVQFIYQAINRWGFCCCEGYVSPKTRQIRKILDSVEQYKTQQLDRLRENYNSQVQKIKDNCTQQLEWIRDGYSNQSERLKDIKEYGSHQITNICDQYSDQVKRVRDYSSYQLTRVRENYIFQRNRIRKFSAHQLIKLRENYKIQQLHLNKILENLNIESCRNTCGRTDSIIFDDETIGPMFNGTFTNLNKKQGALAEGSDQGSHASQYFTPVEGNSLNGDYPLEDVDLEQDQPNASDMMIDKCIGTSIFELDELGLDEATNLKIDEGGDFPLVHCIRPEVEPTTRVEQNIPGSSIDI